MTDQSKPTKPLTDYEFAILAHRCGRKDMLCDLHKNALWELEARGFIDRHLNVTDSGRQVFEAKEVAK